MHSAMKEPIMRGDWQGPNLIVLELVAWGYVDWYHMTWAMGTKKVMQNDERGYEMGRIWVARIPLTTRYTALACI